MIKLNEEKEKKYLTDYNALLFLFSFGFIAFYSDDLEEKETNN